MSPEYSSAIPLLLQKLLKSCPGPQRACEPPPPPPLRNNCPLWLEGPSGSLRRLSLQDEPPLWSSSHTPFLTYDASRGDPRWVRSLRPATRGRAGESVDLAMEDLVWGVLLSAPRAIHMKFETRRWESVDRSPTLSTRDSPLPRALTYGHVPRPERSHSPGIPLEVPSAFFVGQPEALSEKTFPSLDQGLEVPTGVMD